MAKFDKKLASILSKGGLITPEQEEEFMGKVEDDGKSLTELLVETGTVEEEAIIACVSEEMNYPPINLERVSIDPEALRLVPEDLALNFGVLPIAKMGNTLTMAVANPFDLLTIDDIKIITDYEPMPVVSTDMAIKRAIEKAYDQSDQQMEDLFGDLNEDDLELTKKKDPTEADEDMDLAAISMDAENSPVVKLVNLIIFQAIKEGASDIHIETYERRCRVRYRSDGACYEALSPPPRMYPSIIGRLKIMANMDISEHMKPMDGKFQMKIQGRQIDFRVAMSPMAHGEKCMMRILDAGALSLNLESLGFEERALSDFREAINAAYGMILVTGPTGCGKSTTLYSAMLEVLNDEDNITTVEDPVEYQIERINQVPVNPMRGMTFAAALRSILRQDPDTVMIGEMRDGETAEIAVKAALTGHLVLSTLHTNDAASTVTRLIDMGVDRFLVSSCLLLVTGQRLVRKLCKECKQREEVPTERLIEIGLTEEEAESAELLRPVGCTRCRKGYRGRKGLIETLPMTDNVKKIVVEGGSALDVKVGALEDGMETLRRIGILSALRGETSLEEVCGNTMED